MKVRPLWPGAGSFAGHRRLVLAVALSLLLVLSLPAVAVPSLAEDNTTDDTDNAVDRDVAAIDTNHDLTRQGTVDNFRREGEATSELGYLDGEVTVATDGDDVGLSDELLPSSIRNDFIKIDYREDHERTLRIHIPRDYWTPYSQSAVDSATSDHIADYQPVRGGDYLEVVVHVDEPAEIVLPVQRDSATAYRMVERLDNRIEWALGVSLFSGEEFEHIRGDEFANQTSYELEDIDSLDDAVVQFDAEHEDPDQTWLNAPESDDGDVGVYVMSRGGSDSAEEANESVYLVATQDDPPDVRYKPQADLGDRERGWLNDALEIPERIQEQLGDAWPFSVSTPGSIPVSAEVIE